MYSSLGKRFKPRTRFILATSAADHHSSPRSCWGLTQSLQSDACDRDQMHASIERRLHCQHTQWITARGGTFMLAPRKHTLAAIACLRRTLVWQASSQNSECTHPAHARGLAIPANVSQHTNQRTVLEEIVANPIAMRHHSSHAAHTALSWCAILVRRMCFGKLCLIRTVWCYHVPHV